MIYVYVYIYKVEQHWIIDIDCKFDNKEAKMHIENVAKMHIENVECGMPSSW
jgi:hypothetical protein